MTKACTKCGRTLPATEEFFSPGAAYRGGLRSSCKECRRDDAVEYRERHGARRRGTGPWSDPEYRREFYTGWMAANQDKMREYRKKYLRVHADRAREMRALWLAENPERAAAAWRSGRARRRARIAAAPGYYTVDDVLAQMEAQEGRCHYCAQPVTEYHVDHYIPLARGGSNGPENIVIACPPCNLKKGTKMPHEFEVVA